MCESKNQNWLTFYQFSTMQNMERKSENQGLNYNVIFQIKNVKKLRIAIL